MDFCNSSDLRRPQVIRISETEKTVKTKIKQRSRCAESTGTCPTLQVKMLVLLISVLILVAVVIVLFVITAHLFAADVLSVTELW